MVNLKWYYLCDLENSVAIEYIQIPQVWGNVTGLADVDEVTLADMAWSNNLGKGFLTEEKAIELNIDSLTMQKVKELGAEVQKVKVIAYRDALLKASDSSVTIDRWETYDSSKKATISNYRQELRDITNTSNIFNIQWPEIPIELEYLKEIEKPLDV